MKQTCPLYGAHHWQVDKYEVGKCKCGAVEDFKVQAKSTDRPFVQGIAENHEIVGSRWNAI